MKFIIFYLLRKWFMKISCTPKSISVKKGIGVSVLTSIRLCDIVRVTTRQPPLLRLYHAKEIEIFCVYGSVKFYMKADETLPIFSGKHSVHPETADLREQAFLALCETHALVGVAAFSLVIARISRLFNGEYSERILKAISKVSQSVYEKLLVLNIDIPKALVTLAVFAVLSWCFAYVRNLLKYMRFSSEKTSDFVVVKHGVLTLYEHRITLDSIAIREDNPLTLMMDKSFVKMRGVTVCSAQKLNNKHMQYRPSSFWGYCKNPVICGLLCGSLYVASYAEHSALSQLMLLGLCLSAYSLCASALYMRHSGISFQNGCVFVSSQRMQRLYSSVIPEAEITQITSTHFLSGKRSNVTIRTTQRQRLKIRQLDLQNQYRRCR